MSTKIKKFFGTSIPRSTSDSTNIDTAISNLESSVSGIQDVIPSTATTTNQLVTHSDIADIDSTYIKNQNKLSALETISLTTFSQSSWGNSGRRYQSTQYDGILYVSYFIDYSGTTYYFPKITIGTTSSSTVRTTDLVWNPSQFPTMGLNILTFTININKGEYFQFYGYFFDDTSLNVRARFYKNRDYSS